MRVGDKLYCIDGTVAVLQHFDDNLIVVEYNGTLHVRPRSVINQRLFFEPTKLIYDASGYDQFGFNRAGFDKEGYKRSGYNSEGYDRDGYNHAGFDVEGYDRNGFDIDGFSRSGYNRDGYDRKGFNQAGFDRDGYDENGYDHDGYNRNGLDEDGYNREGYNRAGYDREGFDRSGYNKYGYDRNGYDREGRNIRGSGHVTSHNDSKGLLTNEGSYLNAGEKLYVKKGNSWENAEFIRYGFLDTGERVIYVRCADRELCYTYPSTLIRKDAPADDEKKRSNPGECTAYNIAHYFMQNYPKAKTPEQNYLVEFSAEKMYHNCVLEELARLMDTQETAEKHLNQERGQTYWDIRDAYRADREAGGFDPFNQVAIHVNISLENYERRSAWIKREKRKIIEQRHAPYFARVDCGSDLNNVHTVYIGNYNIQNYVTDWRNKEVGNLYYHTAIYLNSPDLTIALKRNFQFDTTGDLTNFTDEINHYKDKNSTNNVQNTPVANALDPLLQRILESNRSTQKVKDIIQTIQSNQYDIITSDFKQNVLINGCAGSGKTMILYHRLSFMAYNSPEFKGENVYVITPSKLFSMYMSDLIIKLELESIHNFTFEEMTADLLDQYCDTLGLKGFYTLMHFKNLHGDYAKSEQVLSCFQSFYAHTIRQEAILGRDDNFCSWLASHLIQILHAAKVDILDQNEIFQYIIGASERRSLFLEHPVEGFNDFELQNIFMYSMENILCRISDPAKKSETKFKTLESTDPLLLRSVFSKKNLLNAHGELETRSGRVDDILKRPEIFKKAVAVQYVQNIAVDVRNGALSYALICRYCMDMFKKENNLSAEYDYGFESVFYLSAFSQRFGALSTKPILLFVDEFQNYSTEALVSLKHVFPNAVFNFFGDYDQRLDVKGISASQMEEMFQVTQFELNENYRNAYEITEFINSTLHKKMLPIGLHGTVTQESIASCKFTLSGRTALIAKDISQSILNELRRKVHIKIISDDHVSIDDSVLNIIDVRLAKGLEFDAVYVIDSDMTESEKYVSYTRALSHLSILSN